MADKLRIEQLLSIEDDPAILDFRCPETGMLLWPHVRIAIFRMIMTDLLYLSDTAGEESPVARSLQLTTLVRSFWWNLKSRVRGARQADVCIVSNGMANQWVNDKLFDRVAGYLSAGLPSTVTLEDHFEWKWPFPRHEERILFLAPRRAYYSIVGLLKVRQRHRDLARDLIDHVRDRALRYLGWRMSQVRADAFVNDLARKMASLPQQYGAYQRLFKRIRPKVMLIGSGCFGGAYATMIAAARSLNIPTAEYQHGAVSAGHDGYNLSGTLRASIDYKATLPDYFLSFGKWWNGQINVPLQTVVIGSPHRGVQLSKLKAGHGDKTDVVILSDGMEFDTYVKLAEAIEPAAKVKGWRVVVRPHPLERSMVEATYGQQIGTILIDQNSDLMASLNQSKMLVSEISTGLFDAIGLTEGIYLWDTPKSRFCYPSHPFVSFSSADELVELVMSADLPVTQLDADAFWAPDWQASYMAFLHQFGIGGRTP